MKWDGEREAAGQRVGAVGKESEPCRKGVGREERS